MDDAQKRREDAWAAMKQMHEDLSKPKEPVLDAAGGWCAPSDVSWQVGPYVIGELGTELVIPVTRGGVTYR